MTDGAGGDNDELDKANFQDLVGSGSEVEPTNDQHNTVDLLMNRGTQLTPELIRNVEREMVMNNGRLSENEESFTASQKRYCNTLFRIHNISFVLVGRIDGVDNITGHLVELKTRHRMLRRRCWSNELIQMQMYMWLSGGNEMLFLEKFREERYQEVIPRDDIIIFKTFLF